MSGPTTPSTTWLAATPTRKVRSSTSCPSQRLLGHGIFCWAWPFYLIFRAKWRQRVIPVLEKNANTSLNSSAPSAGCFYPKQPPPTRHQKMRLFLIFVRERYHLPSKELNEQFAKGLAVRSDIPEEHINKIINLNLNINNSGFLSEDTLVDFHRLMERFYRECR
ncbi:MAG: hypothetical protein IPM82_16525 [Saprospiraceae bacterium]|nr:hypothetical protein [Saprospiraceae bacterium]